jgi:hypothetical protein
VRLPTPSITTNCWRGPDVRKLLGSVKELVSHLEIVSVARWERAAVCFLSKRDEDLEGRKLLEEFEGDVATSYVELEAEDGAGHGGTGASKRGEEGGSSVVKWGRWRRRYRLVLGRWRRRKCEEKTEGREEERSEGQHDMNAIPALRKRRWRGEQDET